MGGLRRARLCMLMSDGENSIEEPSRARTDDPCGFLLLFARSRGNKACLGLPGASSLKPFYSIHLTVHAHNCSDSY